MPRPIGSTTTPSYRHRRSSGQAIVTISGRDFYLGVWKSQASRREYDRHIAEWLANGRRLACDSTDDLTVNELLNAYRKFADEYYVGKSGIGELNSIRLNLRILKRFYGPTLVRDFGPLALRAVREEMVNEDWSRPYINCQIGRVRRMFKWGVSQEIVSPAMLEASRALDGLRRGKTAARETKRVMPVSDAQVAKTLNFVSEHIKAMVQLQQLTGMRPGEVCMMRGCDIDTTSQQTLDFSAAEGEPVNSTVPIGVARGTFRCKRRACGVRRGWVGLTRSTGA